MIKTLMVLVSIACAGWLMLAAVATGTVMSENSATDDLEAAAGATGALAGGCCAGTPALVVWFIAMVGLMCAHFVFRQSDPPQQVTSVTVNNNNPVRQPPDTTTR